MGARCNATMQNPGRKDENFSWPFLWHTKANLRAAGLKLKEVPL